MTISIIVPVYQSITEIKGLFNSIQADSKEDFQIIVIDDGNPNRLEIELLCNAYCAQYISIPREKPFQKCRAINTALSLIESKTVLQLDQDKYPYKNKNYWSVIKHLEKLGPGWACTGPIRNHYPEERRQKFMLSENEISWRGAFGGNIVYHVADLKAIGGFDENFDGAYGWQDVEVAYRLNILRGVRFYYNQNMIVNHVGMHEWKIRSDYERNYNLFIAKHGVSPRLTI